MIRLDFGENRRGEVWVRAEDVVGFSVVPLSDKEQAAEEAQDASAAERWCLRVTVWRFNATNRKVYALEFDDYEAARKAAENLAGAILAAEEVRRYRR